MALSSLAEALEAKAEAERAATRARGLAAAHGAAAAAHSKARRASEAAGVAWEAKAGSLATSLASVSRALAEAKLRLGAQGEAHGALETSHYQEQLRAAKLAALGQRQREELALLKHVAAQKDRHVQVLNKEKQRLMDSVKALQADDMARRHRRPTAAAAAAAASQPGWLSLASTSLPSAVPPAQRVGVGGCFGAPKPPPPLSPAHVHVTPTKGSRPAASGGDGGAQPWEASPSCVAGLGGDAEDRASSSDASNTATRAPSPPASPARGAKSLGVDSRGAGPSRGSGGLFEEGGVEAVRPEGLATGALVAQLRRARAGWSGAVAEAERCRAERDRALARCENLVVQLRNKTGRA